MPVGKSTPRFLPTLTEVVHPVAPSSGPVVDRELLIEGILQRVAPVVEAQLKERLQLLVREHMDAIFSQLHAEMESAIRDAVTQAVEQENTLGT